MALKNHTLKTGERPASTIETAVSLLQDMTEIELAQLRHEIDERLQLDLANLNLTDELGLQYRQGKALLSTIQNDPSIAANQKSQVYNTVRSQLSEIITLQEVVWNMERLKKFEVAFVKSVGTLTDDAKKAFFDLYGQYLKDPSDQAN